MKYNKKLEQIIFSLDRLGETIDVPIRYSTKAKRIIIKIHHNNVELILPNKNINAGYKFLLEKEPWVRSKLKSAKQEGWSEQGSQIIPILGKPYSLLKVDSIRNHVQIKDDMICVDSFPYAHNRTIIKFLQT